MTDEQANMYTFEISKPTSLGPRWELNSFQFLSSVVVDYRSYFCFLSAQSVNVDLSHLDKQ